MIKRLSFASGDEVQPLVAAAAELTATTVRTAVCTVLPELTPGPPRHDVVVLQWFADLEHLHRAGPAPRLAVVAEEVVLRGQQWLDQRWRDGGDRLKHMALATRADGLDRAAFSAAWRGHAGRTGRGPGTPVPEQARGSAYAQDHPLRDLPDPLYDAVNEVWCDDLAALQARAAWFAGEDRGDPELFRDTWFLAVREHVLHP